MVLMSIKISAAPASWGVDDPENPYLPDWQLVLREAAQAGYKGIELGPYGYLPLNLEEVSKELENNNLTITAGTIFDDLVDPDNLDNLLKMTDDICSLITKLPTANKLTNQRYSTPYLTVMDFGHSERDIMAGHPEDAPRLSEEEWNTMVKHIKKISELARDKYGVRAVIHPHAGGYIEFADEIEKIIKDISKELAGLCLDTGHLYYSKMDPVDWIKKNSERVDYIHFKDIDLKIYKEVMNKEIKFFDACADGVMCPIGKGIIDYDAINEMLKDINYGGWITIEQERDPRNSDSSLKDVKKSYEYLKSVGY
jgi:inosose dehydratase